MLKMNVSNMCKEVHRVRVLYVHVFVSVYNFLRWNKIIKYKKKKKNYKVHVYVISMEFSAVNRRRPSRETPLRPGAKKDGCFRRLT